MGPGESICQNGCWVKGKPDKVIPVLEEMLSEVPHDHYEFVINHTNRHEYLNLPQQLHPLDNITAYVLVSIYSHITTGPAVEDAVYCVFYNKCAGGMKMCYVVAENPEENGDALKEMLTELGLKIVEPAKITPSVCH